MCNTVVECNPNPNAKSYISQQYSAFHFPHFTRIPHWACSMWRQKNMQANEKFFFNVNFYNFIYRITSLIQFPLYRTPAELQHIILLQSIIKRSRSFYQPKCLVYAQFTHGLCVPSYRPWLAARVKYSRRTSVMSQYRFCRYRYIWFWYL